MGDYIGISGIEQSYEKELRGRRGTRYMMVDNFNREKDVLKKENMIRLQYPVKT